MYSTEQALSYTAAVFQANTINMTQMHTYLPCAPFNYIVLNAPTVSMKCWLFSSSQMWSNRN